MAGGGKKDGDEGDGECAFSGDSVRSSRLRSSAAIPPASRSSCVRTLLRGIGDQMVVIAKSSKVFVLNIVDCLFLLPCSAVLVALYRLIGTALPSERRSGRL